MILFKRVNITDRVAVVNVVVAVLSRMRVVLVCRSLVSASQDGKLIVWDGYTTNKARKILPTYLFAVKIVKICHNVVLRVYSEHHKSSAVQLKWATVWPKYTWAKN